MSDQFTKIAIGIGFAIMAPVILPFAVPIFVGMAIGFGAGYFLGGALFPSNAEIPGLKPEGLQIQTSQLGQAIPVLYGSRKMAGNLIWYGNFQTHENTEESGGKGGGGQSSTTYTYSVSMAWGLCFSKNNKATVTKAWVGKDKKFDAIQGIDETSGLTMYDGSQTTPDPHIQAMLEADGKTRFPVWKNLTYVEWKIMI